MKVSAECIQGVVFIFYICFLLSFFFLTKLLICPQTFLWCSRVGECCFRMVFSCLALSKLPMDVRDIGDCCKAPAATWAFCMFPKLTAAPWKWYENFQPLLFYVNKQLSDLWHRVSKRAVELPATSCWSSCTLRDATIDFTCRGFRC